jgi:hypothetical protein
MNPVVFSVGKGLPLRRIRYSHAEATLLFGFAFCTQFSCAEVEVMLELVNVVGILQLGGGAQVTLATQPGLLMLPSLLNLKVKQPSALVEVNGPGIVVPQNPPANPPGTLPAGLLLGI